MDVKPGFKRTEVGEIPEDWDITTVGAEFSIQLGKMLDAERNVGELKPYLSNRSVQWGRIDTDDLPLVRMSRADMQKYRLECGDLLVCEGGEVGRAAIWDRPMVECYYQKALHRLRPLKDYRARLLLEVLHQHSLNGILTNFVTQTSIAHLPRDKFLLVPIPMPPEPEQDALIEVVHDVDKLLEELAHLIAKKRDIKQAAMQQLLTGQTRLPGFYGEWEARRLDHAGRCLRGVTYRGDTDLFPHDTAASKRLLRANNIQAASLELRDVQYVRASCVSDAQLLQQEDILICMANGSKDLVGKAALFSNPDGSPYTFGAFVGCFRTDSATADARFVFALLQSAEYRKMINNLLAGSSINNLRPSAVESLMFCFPELDEQRAIARVLGDVDREISALEARRDKTLALKQAMMQELLIGRTRLV
ncbi:MAG: restriction endonuclease subunit S [Gemmatimonadaceae bacterium]|nr:restriction endonuclease subunit S [Gemmatimonadaceae bacterium]